MKRRIIIVCATTSLLIILLNTIISPVIVFSQEKDEDIRPTYSLQEINEGILNKMITFNSIVYEDSDDSWYQDKHREDIPAGTIRNETNFVGAREATGINAGVNNVWEGNSIKVEDGKTYIVRLYVHNNNPNGLDAMAKDTSVRFFIPKTSSKSVTVNGWLMASNAIPRQYVDDVTFTSDTAFHLEYVSGSALLENGNYASGAGVALPDSITNQGNLTGNETDEWTLIGYDGLNGNVPGCYKYVNYITIEVKAFFDYEFTTETKVRLVDSEDRIWKDIVEARIGDKVEFQIEYKNIGDTTQTDVAISNVLPSNLRYISDSVKLYNVNHPTGLSLDQKYLIENGILIGAYTTGSNAIIRFTAEVVNDDLIYGSNTLVNWGQSGVGTKIVQDYARVIVHHDKVFSITIIALFITIIICVIFISILHYKIKRWNDEAM